MERLVAVQKLARWLAGTRQDCVLILLLWLPRRPQEDPRFLVVRDYGVGQSGIFIYGNPSANILEIVHHVPDCGFHVPADAPLHAILDADLLAGGLLLLHSMITVYAYHCRLTPPPPSRP